MASQVSAVNAWADGDAVIVSLRVDGSYWETYSLDLRTAVQFAYQLLLLTGTTD
jgi:hypothetical protein